MLHLVLLAFALVLDSLVWWSPSLRMMQSTGPLTACFFDFLKCLVHPLGHWIHRIWVSLRFSCVGLLVEFEHWGLRLRPRAASTVSTHGMEETCTFSSSLHETSFFHSVVFPCCWLVRVHVKAEHGKSVAVPHPLSFARGCGNTLKLFNCATSRPYTAT